MIKTKNLKFKYKRGSEMDFPDLEMASGEQMAMIGDSGSGKTTLLHLLAGILSPSSGEIVVDNTNICKLKQNKLDEFRGKNFGFIFQKHLFIEDISMNKNLLIAQTLAGGAKDPDYVSQLTEQLEIAKLLNKYPSELSQGELQRFSVARSLVNNPLALFADEPTSSLDDNNCTRFITLLQKVSSEHKLTLLIATHDSRIKKQFGNILYLKPSRK